MKKILLFLFLICSQLHAQYWMQFGGSPTIDEALSITVDSSNNNYTAGYFTNIATFGSLNATSAGLSDIFILKTNPNGSLAWLKNAGGLNIDKANSVAADDAGNIVVTGFFNTVAQFDASSVTSAGQGDIFIAKYNSAGTLLWVVSAGGSGNDVGNGVTFDQAGNIIVTGEFSGSCTFGGVTTLTSDANSIDIFTAKYDGNGNFLWVKQGAAKYTDRGTDVTTDALGNIYVSGIFSDTITFDVVHNNPIYNALFLVKYDASGVEQWCRWMGSGSTVGMGGISIKGNDITVAGNFTGTLFFFGGTGNPSLNSLHPNNIFVCRYNLQGDLIWTHADGSESSIDVQSITSNLNGEVNITGDFNCQMTDFAAQYGDGTFCSIGYSDCYVASYDSLGNWLWARNFGGKQDDFSYSIIANSNGLISIAGSFKDKIISTNSPANFIGYGTSNLNTPIANYCTDANYGKYVTKFSQGNSDAFINSNIDLSRQPFDYFYRTGAICDRPFNGVCISLTSNPILGACPDTIHGGCSSTNIYAVPNIINFIGPDLLFQWSNLVFGTVNHVTSSGYYTVYENSQDGCINLNRTVYVQIDSVPPLPTISDSKGVNTNATSTQSVELCAPDSVSVFATNVGGNSVHWVGFPTGQNPVTITSTGVYLVIVTSPNGCSNSNIIQVVVSNPLQPVIAKLKCVDDLDGNDTIDICLGKYFTMLIYDSITDPTGNLAIFPQWTSANWFCTNGAFVSFNPITFAGFTTNAFYPNQVGNFDFIISAWLHRQTICGVDSYYVSKLIHVQVNPAAGGTIPITVSGSSNLCFGDSVMLVASGAPFYIWNNGPTNDTIYVTQPGLYSVFCSYPDTNAYGCTGAFFGIATINVSYYPQPTVSTIPIDGVICPGDSVVLNCSGTGVFNWQGPNGMLPNNTNIAYANTPGTYYCIQTVTPGCDLVSNTVTVVPYSSPFMIAFPGPYLCNNSSVELDIICSANSTINWLPPLSGSAHYQTIYTPGTYSCVVTSCGILTTLSFTINAGITPPSTQFFSICQGDSILIGGNYYSLAGSYNDTVVNAYGCDSVITSILVVHAPSTVNLTENICNGDSVQVGNSFYSLAGNYTDTLASSTGCDSVVNLNLTINPPIIFNTQMAICNGDSVQIGNNYYSILGNYSDTLNSASGCDSIVNLSLSLNSAIVLNQQLSVCNGDSVLVGNNYYSSPGNYIDSLKNSYGCDSIVYTSLNLSQTIFNQQATLCYGDSISFNGIYLNTSGNYADTLTSSLGCDSVIILSLNIKAPLQINLSGDTTICSGNSTTLTASGGVNYSWQPATGLNNVTGNSVISSPAASIVYTVTANDASGCSGTNSMSINVTQTPTASFSYTMQQDVCSNEFIFINTSINAISYQWNFGDNNTSTNANPNHSFDAGIYTVILMSSTADGCIDTASKQITASESKPFVTIPNIFSPNDDGYNDEFTVKINCIEKMETAIYNRWGKLLFESSDVPPVWNGIFNFTAATEGVYFYRIIATDVSQKTITYTGNITLVK